MRRGSNLTSCLIPLSFKHKQNHHQEVLRLMNMKKIGLSFNKGSTILVEQPFVHVLKSSLKDERCDHCLERTKLMSCTGCNIVRYCDRHCQKKGWYFHKKECKNMQRVAPKILPDAARMLGRIIFKLEKGGAREQSFYTHGQFRVFMDLMSHYNEVKKDSKRMEHFHSLLAVLEMFFGDEILPNPIELLQIYGKMVVNTFCILDGEMQSIGTGMYLAGSVVDHSCDPNAVAIFTGINLNIRTLVDIPSLDWNKIFISYVDLMRNTEERQKDLQETYYFLCQCKRCLDAEEVKLMNASICQKCGQRVLGGTLKPGAVCVACSEVMDVPTWEEIKTICEFTDQQLTNMKDIAYLDVCRMCLTKQDGLLDPMNLRHVRVLDLAMDGCVEMELWEAALDYGKDLITPFQHYYGSVHPLTGVLFMKLGKLALFLNLMEDARKWLKEAAKILLITHGANHPFVREELYSYMRQCTR